MYYVFYMTERQSMLDGFNIQHCSYLFRDFIACSALKMPRWKMGRRKMRSLFLFPFATHRPLRRDAVVVSDPAKD